jgi:hypothetical protein
MLLLDDGSGQDLAPGEMMQRDVLELPLVDLGGMDTVCFGCLVGNGEEGLDSVPPSYFQIVLQLLTL